MLIWTDIEGGSVTKEVIAGRVSVSVPLVVT